ncbi:MAG: M1 family aminopeptidase [Nitrospirota bacterium]
MTLSCLARAAGLFAAGVLSSAGFLHGGAAPAWAGAEPAGSPRLQDTAILSHALSIDLFPDTHRLIAADRMTIGIGTGSAEQLAFSLASSLQVRQIQATSDSQPIDVTWTAESGAAAALHGSQGQRVLVRLGRPIPSGRTLTLEWRYEGIVNDPPREPRHLRFVIPSETSGHIGPQGVYLSGETEWYPDLVGSLATFHVSVTTPRGWVAVTHGREVSRREAGVGTESVTAEWEVTEKTEALTLVANRFVTSQRDWRDRGGRAIRIATYLFPEDAHLADEYLDASARYLEAYSEILGPYPFPKFAVVENFFASGLGMPSFTLLGSGVIKRHYVQPYALGHEIVHSWIGNAVFNRTEAGNWVEGLTTYLANYYYHELTGKTEEAGRERRLMLYGYAVHVRPEQDYPVGSFTRKTDEKDNAIGYQKAAMVFHMLRGEIGETAFWAGVKKLVSDFRGTYADWRDLERIFAETAGRDLRWFFAQWIERTGAPDLTMRRATARPAPTTSEPGGYRLTARVVQAGTPFRFRVQLLVRLEGNRMHRADVMIERAEQDVTVSVPAKPVAVELDPDLAVFRRLDRARLPAMLNLYVTDRRRLVVPPDAGSEAARAPYRELVARILKQNRSRPAEEQTDVVEGARADGVSAAGSVLVLGGPGANRAAAWAVRGCEGSVRISEDGFAIGGNRYEGPQAALLVSCRRPDRPGSVVTLFYGVSPEAAAKVARLLFFYGWNSYVVFRDGAVVARGDWEEPRDVVEVDVEAP